MRGERKLVGLLARDLVFAGKILGRQAHIEVIVGIRIDDRRIWPHDVAAHRYHRHRLESARDDHIGTARADAIGGKRYRLQTRRAITVDRHRRRFDRQPGRDHRRTSDIHPLLRLRERATHNDVIDQRSVNAGTGDRLLDRRRPEVVRACVTQRTLWSLSHSRSHGRNYYRIFHIYYPLTIDLFCDPVNI